MKNILLVGGSGYIGTVIIDDFFNMNIKIKDLDFNIYGDQKEIIRKKTKNVSYVNLDLRDTKLLTKHLEDIDSVVILAGLVGEHITNKYKSLSKTINEDGLINLIDEVENHKNINNVIFVSTCSNYGIGSNKILFDEKSKLKPLSIYAKQKVKLEKFIMSLKNTQYSPCILRFATAFGSSSRMRFDLTVNHFIKSLLEGKRLEIYDPLTWRPYCHVKDFARLIHKVTTCKKNKIAHQIFNAGNNNNNFTKLDIVKKIQKFISTGSVIFKKNDVDKRNYRVDFSKIKKKLKFQTKFSLEYGIKEIISDIKKKKFLRKNIQLGNYSIK